MLINHHNVGLSLILDIIKAARREFLASARRPRRHEPTRTSFSSSTKRALGTVCLEPSPITGESASSLSLRITTEIASTRTAILPYLKHLHHFIAQVIDHLKSDAVPLWVLSNGVRYRS